MHSQRVSILIIEVLHQESVHRLSDVGALHKLFWIFEYITAVPFAIPLSPDCSDVERSHEFL